MTSQQLHTAFFAVLPVLATFFNCGVDAEVSASAAKGGSANSNRAPGGIVESAHDPKERPPLTQAEILAFMPERGVFQFPAPFATEAVRLTNGSDCADRDCVDYSGYSYWRNINNHATSDTMLIFLGLNAERGGRGLSLFSYDKDAKEVADLGLLFPEDSAHTSKNGEGMYFSATLPHALYLTASARLERYDVIERQFDVVFDASTEYPGSMLWQANSSDDDRVHSATLKNSSYANLGCVVYDEQSRSMQLYARQGDFDECQIDKSGEWLVIKENISGNYGEDNRIVHLPSGRETILLDEEGAAGHSDNGHGYMVAEDNWANNPGSARLWIFEDMQNHPEAQNGVEVYHSQNFSIDLGHVSHTNARGDLAPEEQFACSSQIGSSAKARSNEIICYLLDGSQQVLVVAPAMSDIKSPGGRSDYGKRPKANLDPTGEYIFWTANLGGERLDAFIARIPKHKLERGSS